MLDLSRQRMLGDDPGESVHFQLHFEIFEMRIESESLVIL